jgi:hypothetical protein
LASGLGSPGGALAEHERRAAPREQVVDLLGDLLAQGALDDARLQDPAARDDLAEGGRGAALLGQELVELVAGDLARAHEDFAQRIGPPRAAHEADAVVLEADDLLLVVLEDREVPLAAGHRQHLEDVGDAEDLDVALDLSHRVSVRALREGQA